MRCPICSIETSIICPQCIAIGAYFGYSEAEILELTVHQSSAIVPFHEVKKMIYFCHFFSQLKINDILLRAAEQSEHIVFEKKQTNDVFIKPVKDACVYDFDQVFVKEDASKSMVLYNAEGDIGHFGSEERDALFAWFGREVLQLEPYIIPAVMGMTAAGKKFCATPYLQPAEWHSLTEDDRSYLLGLYAQGVLLKLAVLDYLLGQQDRHKENVFLPSRDLAAHPHRIRLIDNDYSFSSNIQLNTSFCYLTQLAADVDFSEETFEKIADWFGAFEFTDLIKGFLQFSLPRHVIEGVIARYILLHDLFSNKRSIQYFLDQYFLDNTKSDNGVPQVRMIDPFKKFSYRTLIIEHKDISRYVHVLTMMHETKPVVSLIRGTTFSADEPVITHRVLKNKREAEHFRQTLVQKYIDRGYVELIRRLFLILSDKSDLQRWKGEIIIMEIRRDDLIFTVQQRKGNLGIYEPKQRISLQTFPSLEDATDNFNENEKKYLTAGFQNIHTVLSSFKQQGILFMNY